jgi:hypothetical protein
MIKKFSAEFGSASFGKKRYPGFTRTGKGFGCEAGIESILLPIWRSGIEYLSQWSAHIDLYEQGAQTLGERNLSEMER